MSGRTWIILLLGALVTCAAGFLHAVQRERAVAVHASSNAVSSLLRSREQLAMRKVPEGKVGSAYSLGDVDFYGRTWLIWFRLEAGGSLAVRVHAAHGIGPVPVFNSEASLVVEDIEFVETN